MSLISLVFIIVLSLHYAAKSIDTLPEGLKTLVGHINDSIHTLSYWGVIYGLIAVVLVPLTVENNTYFLIRLLVNLFIFLMALPLALDQLLEKHKEKVPEVLVSELKSFVGWITRNEKVAGMIGAGIALVHFMTMFN